MQNHLFILEVAAGLLAMSLLLWIGLFPAKILSWIVKKFKCKKPNKESNSLEAKRALFKDYYDRNTNDGWN